MDPRAVAASSQCPVRPLGACSKFDNVRRSFGSPQPELPSPRTHSHQAGRFNNVFNADLRIEEGLFLPMSTLKALRRQAVERLQALRREHASTAGIAATSMLPELRRDAVDTLDAEVLPASEERADGLPQVPLLPPPPSGFTQASFTSRKLPKALHRCQCSMVCFILKRTSTGRPAQVIHMSAR